MSKTESESLEGQGESNNFNWREDPAIVISDLILSNPDLSIHDVSDITGYKTSMVKAIVVQLEIRKLVRERNAQIKKEILQEKVPILKEIVGESLTAIRDYLVELNNNPILKQKCLKSVSDLRSLASVGKDLNEMLRLDLGQATTIERKEVQLSVDQTKQIFAELKANDPVFEYPEIKQIDGGKQPITIEIPATATPCGNNAEDLCRNEGEG